MHIVIVGNGIAGITAAKTIRSADPSATVTVYTNELQTGLIARKDLARHLAEDGVTPETCILETEAALQAAGIQVIYDPVLRLFARTNQVLINHSIRASYDRLLLATGATPRLLDVPGHHLLGVHQARSYEDFTFIENWLPDLQTSGAAVIGGGILGMDMAFALASRRVPVTLIVREAALGVPWLPADQAQLAQERLSQMGVHVRLEAEVTAFESDDGRILDRVALSSGGAVNTFLAINCIGVSPNTDFLDESGIALDADTGAILVGDDFQTNLPGVYAAGGCALVAGRIAQTWHESAEQGRLAALHLLGQPASAPVLNPVPLIPLILEPQSAPV